MVRQAAREVREAVRAVNRRRTFPPVQDALVCDGMRAATLTGAEVTEENIGEVFHLWAERVADVNAAIDAARDLEGILSGPEAPHA